MTGVGKTRKGAALRWTQEPSSTTPEPPWSGGLAPRVVSTSPESPQVDMSAPHDDRIQGLQVNRDQQNLYPITDRLQDGGDHSRSHSPENLEHLSAVPMYGKNSSSQFGKGQGPPSIMYGEPVKPMDAASAYPPDSFHQQHMPPPVSQMYMGGVEAEERKREGCMGWFIWLTAKYPFVLAIIIPVIALGIIGGARFPEYPAFIEGNRPRGSLEARQYDAYFASRDDWLELVDNSVDIDANTPFASFTQENRNQTIQVWFESKSSNIMSDENLRSQQNILTAVQDVVKDFCLRDPTDTSKCRNAFSAFDRLGTTDPAAVRQAAANANTFLTDRLKAFFGVDVDFAAGTGTWAAARVPIGGPLPGYVNIRDRPDEQNDLVNEEFKFPGFTGLPKAEGWIRKIEKIIEDEQANNDDIRVKFASSPMIGPVFFQALLADALLSIGALLAVGIIMWLQVGSVMLAIAGMSQIVISFVLTLTSWKIIGNSSFTFNQVLIIFIILGIGADDVFVFMDAWKQSRLQPKRVSGFLTNRLAWTWTRAFTAMLVTTATTIGAFVLTSIIDVPAIATFGTFAAICVAWNFFFCVVWFPNIVIIHDRFIVNKNSGCCAKRVCGCCCQKCGPQWGLDEEGGAPHTADEHMQNEGMRKLEKFFKFRLHEFLTRPAMRYGVFTLFLTFMVIGIALAATQVRLTEKSLTESFLKEGDDIQVTFNLLTGASPAFTATEDGRKRQGHIVYGLDTENPIDRAGTYALGEGDQIGEPVFSNVDLNSEAFQSHLVDTCGRIGQLPTVSVTIRDQRPEVICFMSDFKAYREARGESFPVTPAGLVDALLAWRKNVCTVAAPGCFKNMNKTGVAQLDEDYDRNTGFLYDYDTKMIHMAFVSGNLSIPFLEQELQVIEPEYLEWKELGEQQNKDGFTPFAITDRTDWIMLMYTLINGVVSGVPLAVAVAFIVLVCATANWWVSLMASLTIMGIMSSFFITFVAMKGKLGYYECMFLQITVGMSVDYVVHLAHSYNSSRRHARADKMQDSLGEMGISVFSGAITTLAASGLLFACKFNAFFEYGSFIFFVIFWSILWAIIMFPAMMIQFGPQGRSGDIPPIVYIHKLCWAGLEDHMPKDESNGVHTAGSNYGNIHAEVVRVDAPPARA
mmetsp:Transcript_59937/g.147347  ORF Transcript_59937/g.147347 Transcript_59937/m.147347 type:complete len:1142 (-) Transcript_59937:8-3433(-)